MSGALIRHLERRIHDLERYILHLESQLQIDKGGPEGPPPPTHHNARVPQRSDDNIPQNLEQENG